MGLLDFLSGNGGLLSGFGGGQSGPLPINNYGQAQQMGGGYPGGIDPAIIKALGGQQPNPLLTFGLGLASGNTAAEGIRGALNQIADPEGRRAQMAIQNYIALKKLGLEERAAQEKPQYQISEDPNTGLKRIVLLQPYGQGASYVNPTEPGGASAPPTQPIAGLPPGADVKTAREKLAAAAIANQEEAVKSAKAAADFQPVIDQAVEAYQRAIDTNAVGPISGSKAARAFNTYSGIGAEGEKARQDYDRAKAAVAARITASQNKGEGAVSNFERQMYSAQFPDLTNLDPQSQLRYLKQIQAQTAQTAKAGQITGLGQTPETSAVMNRPSIPGGLQPPGQQAPAAGIPQPKTKAEYDALPSGSPYLDPNGTPRTKK